MAAATKRITRLKRIDRAAVAIITLGGLLIVAAVLGILVFIGAEAIPLFRSARVEYRSAVPSHSSIAAANARAFRAFGIDEYLRYFFTVEPDGRVPFRRLTDGAVARELAVPALDGAAVTATSISLLGHFVAAGMSDGRVALMQVRFRPVFTDQTVTDVTAEVVDRGGLRIAIDGSSIQQIDYGEQDGVKVVAALTGERSLVYWHSGTDEGPGTQTTLRVPAGERITQVRVGRNGAVIAGTDRGRVHHWEGGETPRLTDVSPVSGGPIGALEWLIGGQSYVAATGDGEISSWFRAPVGEDGAYAMVRAHDFAPQRARVIAIARSPRDRSFATAGDDGSIVLRHQTSERTLATALAEHAPWQLTLAPRGNALLALSGGEVAWHAVGNPHPEVSWRVLFGKVWYEGYPRPEYVWQSTGATDDFEPKLSLVPLVFGTLKATVYALLFAIPLAVLAALYTSQFVHPRMRARIKPTVEIMAALPSVVIGFLAGLYLASIVERHLTAVFLMMVLLPAFGTAGILVWRLLPRPLAQRLTPGTEVLLIIPMLLMASGLAIWSGPFLELWLFGGDARAWLLETFGVTYDQRNSLVVGIAMGFAVIPIIFTISEDAFSSVPSSLTAASLALGASRWQTATRVVLPTASPGVFSAIMVGFGRAVGETMIVRMATGNTPVMDWSIFNGMRTLSANIAVEIPEAPEGGTLYRVLFLAGSLLFVLTFGLNTIAELVRQRLRERYKAI